jgi:hypothetical protein
LYRLPKVIAAVRAGQRVYVVEGEKDVHAVERAGGVATTSRFGAGKWRDEYAEVLAGANVTVVADADQTGLDHAEAIWRSIRGRAREVRVVRPAEGKDASDHLAAGRGLDEFAPVRAGEGSVDSVGADKAAPENSAADTGDGWEEPVPLGPVVPAFPVDALPPVLREWVTAVSTAVQVPTDLPALQTLSGALACDFQEVRRTCTGGLGRAGQPIHHYRARKRDEEVPGLPSGDRTNRAGGRTT